MKRHVSLFLHGFALQAVSGHKRAANPWHVEEIWVELVNSCENNQELFVHSSIETMFVICSSPRDHKSVLTNCVLAVVCVCVSWKERGG